MPTSVAALGVHPLLGQGRNRRPNRQPGLLVPPEVLESQLVHGGGPEEVPAL